MLPNRSQINWLSANRAYGKEERGSKNRSGKTESTSELQNVVAGAKACCSCSYKQLPAVCCAAGVVRGQKAHQKCNILLLTQKTSLVQLRCARKLLRNGNRDRKHTTSARSNFCRLKGALQARTGPVVLECTEKVPRCARRWSVQSGRDARNCCQGHTFHYTIEYTPGSSPVKASIGRHGFEV